MVGQLQRPKAVVGFELVGIMEKDGHSKLINETDVREPVTKMGSVGDAINNVLM